MTQRIVRRLISFVFVFGALALMDAAAFAQTYPVGASHLSDMKPGSVLFFNRYTSNPSNPQQGDTQINITNTNQSQDASLHFFLVDGSTCTIADSFVGLTPNQTASFLMSDIDPGITGYIVAVAVSGGPTQFNWLIGDEYIRETDGRQANLAAVAIAKRSGGSVEPDENGTAALVFDDKEYERLPSSVAVSNFNSQTTDNTQLTIYCPTPNLLVGVTPTTTSVFTLVYDDTERVFSTTTRFVCYATIQLGTMRVAGGNVNTIIPAGRTGWIRLNGGGKPLLGATIQRGPVFMGGHNLHTLTLLPSYSITVPAFGF
jgi:hypothetical protein